MRRVTPAIEGERIGNFSIDLYRIVQMHANSKSASVPYVELAVAVMKGDGDEKVRIPLTDVATADWESYNRCASLDPKFSVTKSKRYIAHAIKEVLEELPAVDVYRLSHPGFYRINGMPVFCTGGEVIRPSSGAALEVEIEPEAMPQHLDYDPTISEKEAAAAVLNLVSLFPNPGRVILSQVLVSLMRQAYVDAGKPPSFSVFLYGPSGTQKTTIASFLTQVYNRGEGIAAPTRLSASIASAVNLLMDTADQVLIFDDLFPSDTKQVRQKQEEVLSEITRYIGDGTIPARMKGDKVRQGRPKCGVLFTGEYIIGEGSDAARLLPVKMTKPDTVALRDFQDRPLVLSTFYRNFISWFVENYDEIVSYLRGWLDEYRKTDLGVHDRLRETHFFLNTAYSLMMGYCEVKGVLEEANVQKFHSSFVGLLARLVREQNKRVSPTTSHPPAQGHVLERIRELFRTGEFSIPDDKRQFDERQHDGVKHKGCLCLRPQALSRFFPSIEISDIVCELDDQGALNKGKDSPAKKISALKGKYFYWIPLSCL